MAATLTLFDSQAEVNGATLQVALAAFRLPQQAEQLLQKHGLPTAPQAGSWYPVRAWINVLTEVEERYGAQTVYAAGLHVVECCVWPAQATTLAEALHSLSEAHHANVRGQNVGYYSIVEQGSHDMRVECLTPVPASFDWGIITGVARRFKPAGSLRVWVEPEATPPGSPPSLKWFRVKW